MNENLPPMERVVDTATKQREQGQKERAILDVLQDGGIEQSYLTPQMMERLLLLRELTPTFEDEKQAVEYAIDINHDLRDRAPDRQLTDDEMDAVFGGTFFSDIGKTGPANATPEQSFVVARMYGVDARFNPTGTTRQFIEKFLPDDAENLIETLDSIEGLSPDTTMREFWNAHVYWSYDLIKQSRLPEASKRAAASHHILEGNFP